MAAYPLLFKGSGLVRHIESFDNFIREGWIRLLNQTEKKSTVDGKTIISYSKIRVGFPDVELSYEQGLQHQTCAGSRI